MEFRSLNSRYETGNNDSFLSDIETEQQLKLTQMHRIKIHEMLNVIQREYEESIIRNAQDILNYTDDEFNEVVQDESSEDHIQRLYSFESEVLNNKLHLDIEDPLNESDILSREACNNIIEFINKIKRQQIIQQKLDQAARQSVERRQVDPLKKSVDPSFQNLSPFESRRLKLSESMTHNVDSPLRY